MRPLVLVIPLSLLTACATTQAADENTPEQYICANAETRVEKGGQEACEIFYAGYRTGDDPCNGATKLECVKMLQSLEIAGFSPKIERVCTDAEIAAYRAATGTGLNDAALRAADCP